MSRVKGARKCRTVIHYIFMSKVFQRIHPLRNTETTEIKTSNENITFIWESFPRERIVFHVPLQS